VTLEGHPLLHEDPSAALIQTFESTNAALSTTTKIQYYSSGATCVTVLTLGQKLFCSNVGDSRGIVVKKK
jgi:serine/threonine protein phosphatase PrpC